MKILFSPSEAKFEGGICMPINQKSFCFENLYEKRLEAITIYNNAIQNNTNEHLQLLFGIKNLNAIKHYKKDLFLEPTTKAVMRYSGVAYKYLDYKNMDEQAQKYIDEHLIIFSNLFGPIYASDKIPEYKLKQNRKIGNFDFARFYKEKFSAALDEDLKENGPIVDLRAGYYDKFYTTTMPRVTMKFLKNKKVVSHWAKAYRGIMAKEIAINDIENIDDLLAMPVDGLQIIELKKIRNSKEIVYEIMY